LFVALGETVDRHTELPAKAWYLLQCKPRQDGRAREHLQRQGFECFAPELTVQIVCAGKLREQQQPLFPGYVFIRMGEEDSWLSLRSTRGVNRVVAFCGQPCRVQDATVDHLRLRCEVTDSKPAFTPGDRVQVRVGEFADMEAIFLSMDGEERVMLLLSVLNRQHQIQVRLTNVQSVQQQAVALL
jgi:transcriptional antiterminator RfaH